MTGTAYCSAPMSFPQTQNTAPVLEFNCLYTRDVKKKSKKWQDGFMRYHTFNKRVMVYDVPRNHVGGLHWTGNEAVREGDELTLERDGIMVEVGENLGQTETDLNELRQSRKKAPSANISVPARSTPALTARAASISSMLLQASTQRKHRSLDALLGNPKGSIIKAQLPKKSPVEENQARGESESQEWEEGRPAKRSCVASAPAWNVTRTTKTPKAAIQAGSALRSHTADAAKRKKKAAPQPGQQQRGTKEFVELSDDDEPEFSSKPLPGFSSDLLLVSPSPVRERTRNVQKLAVGSSSSGLKAQPAAFPLRQTMVQSKPKRPHTMPPLENDEVTKRSEAPSAQPAAVSNRVRNKSKLTGSGDTTVLASLQKSVPSKEPKASKSSTSKSQQTFRLAETAPKKKTLLCQNQLTKKLKRINSTNANDSWDELLGDVPMKQSSRRRLDKRLAEIESKNGSTSMARLNITKTALMPDEIDSEEILVGDVAVPYDIALVDMKSMETSHDLSAMPSATLDRTILPLPAPSLRGSSQQLYSSKLAPEPKSDAQLRSKSRPASPRPQQQPIQPPGERQLRRVLSKTLPTRSPTPKRVPGAAVRFTPTPSPTKRSRKPSSASRRPEAFTKSASETSAPSPEVPKRRKLFEESVHINMTSNCASTVIPSKPFPALGQLAKRKTKLSEPPKDLGPWSREAFDLFTWRPPIWDEERWCAKDTLYDKTGMQQDRLA